MAVLFFRVRVRTLYDPILAGFNQCVMPCGTLDIFCRDAAAANLYFYDPFTDEQP